MHWILSSTIVVPCVRSMFSSSDTQNLLLQRVNSSGFPELNTTPNRPLLHAGLSALSLSLWSSSISFEQIQSTVAEISGLVSAAEVELMDRIGLLHQLVALVSRSSQPSVQQSARAALSHMASSSHFAKQLTQDQRLLAEVSSSLSASCTRWSGCGQANVI